MSQTDLKIVKEKDIFPIIKETVNEMVDLLRLTYGPAGKKIIISKMTHNGVFDDGVQGARDYDSNDPVKKAIIRLVRETAQKTNERAGDGTTGAMIVLQAIINEIARKNKFDARKIEIELKKGLEELKNSLLKSAKQIKTKEELKKVAMISFDNEEIAEMLADLYFKLGKNGMITIDRSPTMKTTSEFIEGLKIATGYISPFMVNNQERMEAVLEKPYILITDYRLTENSDLVPILSKIVDQQKIDKNNRLVIIAENVEQNALATIIMNLTHMLNPETKQPGVLKMVAVALPKVEDRTVLLEDLALLTGARVFSQSKGDRLEDATLNDLGSCDKFISKREESIILGPKGNKGNIKSAIKSLKEAIENETNKEVKEKLIYRLGMFTNTLALIKVGAPTENEQKALKYKVEDAVNAVKSAYVHGVVCGSGMALARVKTSSKILNEALKYPYRQLVENMDMDEEEFKDGQVKNVVSGEVGNFMDVGVVDPVDVLISAVESAVSIASILISSCGMIVESPKEPKIVD